MSNASTIKDTVMHAAAILMAAIIVSTMPISGGLAAATHKGSGASSTSGEAVTPPEIAEFMALLADPKVQKWLLEEQHTAEAAQKPKPREETGLGIHRLPCRCDPRAHRRTRHRTRSAEPVRAGRRRSAGRD